MIQDIRPPTPPADTYRESPGTRRRGITHSLLAAAREIAHASRASAIFVYADALLGGEPVELPDGLYHRVVSIVRTPEEQRVGERCCDEVIRVPNVPLTRMGQVKIAVFLALSRGMVQPGDVIVCLTGIADSGALDTLVVVDVGQEFGMVLTAPDHRLLPEHVRPEVVERVIALATELGSEGREGRPVGSVFVVGDTENVLRLSRQMILNPFQGYPECERRMDDPGLEETIKELSILDGAFIVRGDGVVQCCGALLEVANHQLIDLPGGLGTRHHAAAAITAATDSVAVAISESTGAVTIFRHGKVLAVLKRPRGGRGDHSVYPESE